MGFVKGKRAFISGIIGSENKGIKTGRDCVLPAVILAAALLMAGCGVQKNGSLSSENAISERASVSAAEGAASADATGYTSETAENLSGNNCDAEVIITSHQISATIDGTEYANVKYNDIQINDEKAAMYPELAKVLKDENESMADNAESTAREYASYAADDLNSSEVYNSESNASVMRFDDKLITIRYDAYDYSGGAHGNYGSVIENYDVNTGDKVTAADLIDDRSGAADAIADALISSYGETAGTEWNMNSADDIDASGNKTADGESAKSYVSSMVLEEIKDDSIQCTVSGNCFYAYFGPYTIASYAAGEFETRLPLDKYGDLFSKKYAEDGSGDISKQVLQKTADIQTVTAERDESDNDSMQHIEVKNPSWKYYKADGQNSSSKHIKLKVKNKEKHTAWLDEDWELHYGFSAPVMPYEDKNWTYCPSDSVAYDYMFNTLTLYPETHIGGKAYEYDLSELCNGPDEASGTASDNVQYLRYAVCQNDILYVSLMYNGYAKDEPDSGYMAAIDIQTGDVLWKSEPLTSNARNFIINGDTIICGYGFTAEDDYIYLLDKNTGERTDALKISKAPDEFAVEDGILYVWTYDTAYEYEIMQE